MSFERFCQPACFFAVRFAVRQPKTPVRNATSLRTFSFEDYHYAFQETLCPVTLTHQIFVFYSNLHFYTSDTFRPILALFTHFTLHQFFLVYITTRNTFLIPDDAVARNLIIFFDFTSQRPHLNYIFHHPVKTEIVFVSKMLFIRPILPITQENNSINCVSHSKSGSHFRQ